MCRKNTRKTFADGRSVCSVCRRTETQALEYKNLFAWRDDNGSLICRTCLEPFPYAEPDSNNQFHCYGCRREKQLKEENAPAIRKSATIREAVLDQAFAKEGASGYGYASGGSGGGAGGTGGVVTITVKVP